MTQKKIKEKRVEPILESVSESTIIPKDIAGRIIYVIKNYKNEDGSSIDSATIDSYLALTSEDLIIKFLKGYLDIFVKDFIKLQFGTYSNEINMELMKYSNSNVEIKYHEEKDVVIFHNNDTIFGEKFTNMQSMREEYSEEKYTILFDNVAIIANVKGYKFVTLCESALNNNNSIYLNFTINPDFDVKTVYDNIIFGKSYEVKIPSKPLHPGKNNIKEYINSGVNPYSKWDSIFRDPKSNIIYGMANKNNILILIKRYYISAIELIRYELTSTPEEIIQKAEKIYEGEKKEMLIVFSDKTKKELSQNYNDLKKDVSEGEKRLLELSEEFAKVGRAVKDGKRDLSYFNIDRMNEDAIVLAHKQFNKLYKIPTVSLVQYIEGNIIIYTNNIYKFSKKDKQWHDTGTFKITVSWTHKAFSNDYIKIYPLKWDNKSSDYITSHVFKNSNQMCYGNTVNVFAKCYANRDVFGIVYNVIDFLKSENIEDPASVSDTFPLVPESVVKSEVYQKLKKELSYDDLDPNLL